MTDEEKVGWSGLKWYLKIAAVGGFIYVVFLTITFIVGFVMGYAGTPIS